MRDTFIPRLPPSADQVPFFENSPPAPAPASANGTLLEIARGLACATACTVIAGGRARRVASKPLLAGFQELLRPVVIEALGDPLRAGKARRSTSLAAQALKHDAILSSRRVLPCGVHAADCPVIDLLPPALFVSRIFLSHLRLL